MKRIFALILTVVLLCSCAPPYGVVKEAKVTYSKSDKFSSDDIHNAIEVTKNYFRKNFYGCSLLEIGYAGDETLERELSYRSDWDQNSNDIIFLISSFYVYPGGGDGSLQEDSTYTNWLWILKRTDSGWEHYDHGY